MTTGFEGDAVNLEIDNYGLVIAPSLLAAVGDAITLTSWPGLLPVMTSKSVVAGTGAGMGDPSSRESRVSLAIPLDRADEWFAVHIGPLPSGVALSPWLAYCATEVNGCILRITRKHFQLPVSVFLRASSPNKPARIIVGFSEYFILPSDGQPAVHPQDDQGNFLPCQSESYPAGKVLPSVVLQCPDNTALRQVRSIAFGNGVSSAGKAASSSHPATQPEGISIDVSSLRGCGPGCQSGRLAVTGLFGW